MDKFYLIDYINCEEINGIIRDINELYDGGYGVEYYNNIEEIKDKVLDILEHTEKKGVKKYEPFQVFISEYSIIDSNFKEVSEKIQNYIEYYKENDGYLYNKETGNEELMVPEDYIKEMQELKFEKGLVEGEINNANIERDIFYLFKDDIKQEIEEISDKILRNLDKEDEQEKEEILEEIKEEILEEIKDKFHFSSPLVYYGKIEKFIEREKFLENENFEKALNKF